MIVEIMKKRFQYIILLAIFLLPGVNSEAVPYWEKVDLPSGFDRGYYLDVFFLESNPQYGWACGYSGDVLRTTDGGETWSGVRIMAIGGEGQLESIHFTNELVGYTSGQENIFKTTDGGRTWFDVSPTTNFRLWGNFFIDENYGLVIGGGCGDSRQYFFRTTNGGLTWSYFIGTQPNTGLCDLVLYSRDGLGYASSSGYVWRTTNGGRSWSVFSKSGDNDWQEELSHYGNTFLLPYSGACTGGGPGGMRISTDLGQTWKQEYVGSMMFGSFLHDEKRGWACGHDESVYYTSDAGETWQLVNCGIEPGDHLDDIWFINDTTGWVVGDGVYKFIMKKDSIKPEITIDPDTIICPGESIRLTAEEGFKNYYWSTGERSRSILVTEPGDYWVVAENHPCDRGPSDTINISFHSKPDAELLVESDQPLCEGDSARITLLQDFDSYIWNTGETTQSIFVTRSGVYSVTFIDSNGCEWTEETEVQFMPNPKPEILIVGKKDICEGDTTILQATPGFMSYDWFRDDGDDTTNVLSGSNTLEVGASGVFYVVVENTNGCSNVSDPVSINVRPDTNNLEIVLMPGREELFIDSVYYPNIACTKLEIKNVSWEAVDLEDVIIYINTAFSIPQSQFPLTIPAQSSAYLNVCYSPTEIAIERDTLMFPDVCWPHYVYLKAEGLENIFDGNTRCDVPVRLVLDNLPDKYIFYGFEPYPNPGGGNIFVPFSRALPEGAEPTESCLLMNSLGQVLATGKEKITDEIAGKNYVRQYGEFVIDVSRLPQGIYLVLLKYQGGSKVFTVFVER